MTWPLSQDYNEAIQSPASAFADPDLRRGEAATNALGIPAPCSGNFADVYQVRCPDGSRWAVKCFTREAVGLRERYQAISEHLRRAKLPFTVDFTYLEQGIRVAGKWYPVLKMQWVEGLTLNQFAAQNLDKPAMLEALLQIWARMGKHLRAAEIGHCDLQHGNVLLVPGSTPGALALKLIDYDGMWVPALAGKKSGEVGHPNYQHPQRLKDGTYSLEVDRFPLLLVATAMRALKADKGLWAKYDNGDNMLFKESDLAASVKSRLFYDLTRTSDPTLKPLTDHLIQTLRGGLEATPLLDEVMPDVRSASPSYRPEPKSGVRLAAPNPVAPSAVSVAPLVPAAAAPAAPAWNFNEPAAKAAPLRARRQRRGGGAGLARVGAVAAALVVLFGLLGAYAFWAMGGPSEPHATPPSPAHTAPALLLKTAVASKQDKPPEADAILVLQVDQEGAEVSVDGEKQDVDVPGDGKPVTIRLIPGTHKVSVAKDGFKTAEQDVQLAAGRQPPIPVRLVAQTQAVPPPVAARFPILHKTGVSRVEDEALVLDNIQGQPGADVVFGDPQWVDYDFQVEVKRLAGNTQCALWFRMMKPVPPTTNIYVFAAANHLATLGSFTEGGWRGVADDREINPVENDRWYTLAVSVRDARIRCALDGKNLFDAVQTAHPQGAVGLHANGSRYAFRNIKVTSPDGKVLLEGLPDLGTVAEMSKPEPRPPEKAAVTPDPPPSASTPADGFTTLFNGADLAEWSVEKGEARQWTVEGGAIIGSSSGLSTQSFLLSAKEYGDFTLRCDFLVEPSGCGGVLLRAVEREKLPRRGSLFLEHPRLELNDPAKFPDDHSGTTHWMKDDKINCQPSTDLQPPTGIWHTLEITVQGNACTAMIDGKKATDVHLDTGYAGEFIPGLKRAKGKVGLTTSFGRIRYRRIEIRDLTPTTSQTAPQSEDDPIQAKLDAAKADFDAAVKKYQQKVHAGLDRVEDIATQAGNKDLVAQVQTEREAFDKYGDLPNALSSAADFRRDEMAARGALDSALDAAIKAYIKAQMNAKAEAVQEDRKKFQKEHPTDVFQAGTVWQGKAEQVWAGQTNVSTTDYTLTVLERDGTAFKATVAESNGNVREVRGAIVKGVIRWSGKDVKILGGNTWFGVTADVGGELVENTIILASEWIGGSSGRTLTKKVVKLQLTRK